MSKNSSGISPISSRISTFTTERQPGSQSNQKEKHQQKDKQEDHPSRHNPADGTPAGNVIPFQRVHKNTLTKRAPELDLENETDNLRPLESKIEDNDILLNLRGKFSENKSGLSKAQGSKSYQANKSSGKKTSKIKKGSMVDTKVD